MVGGGGLLLGSSDEEAIELLPPGFRFHPTDEEIIMHYLLEKAVDRGFTARAISEADLNKCEPWDLPEKAKMGEKEWFFFFQRDRKYPTGMRTNRTTESGYWKATGKDKEIYYKPKNYLVGMKKTLVFYKGRAPKGDKTNWVMHEYRLDGDVSNYNINISRAAKEEFVVCRVFHKTTGIRRPAAGMLPPLMDYTNYNMEGPRTRLSTNYDHKEEGTNIHEYSYSSSRVFLNNQLLQNQLQYPQYNYHDSTNDTTLLQNPSFPFPAASIFPNYQPQTSLGYQLSQGLGSSSVISSYHHPNINIFPFKGNSRIMNPKREQYISTNNSMIISHSEETGLISTEESKGGEVESENIIIKAFDDQELDGLGFGPTISDLDSLWGY